MNYNPQMLKLARELRGFTQASLSLVMGVAQGTISKVEKGIMSFDQELAIKSSKTLDLPLSFFENVDVLIPIIGEYRRKISASVRQFNSNFAKMLIAEQHLLKLIDAIELPENNLPIWDVDSDGSPSMCATFLRKKWGVMRGRIDNITELVEDNGVIVIPLSLDSMDGFSMFTKNKIPIIFVNKDSSADRYRFTIAHELGHLIMHLPFVNFEGRDKETETNEFGSEFLMPSQEIRPQLVSLSLNKLLNLKRYWKVSMQSIVYKAKTLGVMSPNQLKYMWSQISAAGYKKAEPIVFDHEHATSIKQIFNVYLQDLGYTQKELADILRIHVHEMNNMYLVSGRPRLKVV